MTKRKLILLHNDRTVSWTKKSIQKLRERGKLKGVRWVLIPIMHTSATYVAVSGDTILSLPFRSADVRFQLQIMSNDADIIDPKNVDMRYHSLFDYYPVTMTVYTWEELINALYNVQCYRYLRDLTERGDSKDGAWFMNVISLKVTLWASRRDAPLEEFEASSHEAADCPFDVDILDEICDVIWKRLSYFTDTPNNTEFNCNLVMTMHADGKERWETTLDRLELWSNISHAGYWNANAMSFTILSGEDFERSLMMESADIILAPIQIPIDKDELSKFPIPKAELTVTTLYELPKYEFTGQDFREFGTGRGEEVYYYYNHCIPLLLSYDLHMHDDVICALDHCYFFMQVAHEGIKALAAQLMFEDSELDRIDELHNWTTVFLDFSVHLGSINSPVDDLLLWISSDPFQDYPPNLEEVCYLLKLYEKEA